ncbi:hypothetical protein TNCV_970751 [Trichonephila clavipes]|nr:hypothetical protein TNCV_970751 [Trichonephila clavipes]
MAKYDHNPPAHSFRGAFQEPKRWRFEILMHLFYSPDIAPSDIFITHIFSSDISRKQWSSGSVSRFHITGPDSMPGLGKVTGSILLIGDLDTELRKTPPSRSCRGSIYPPQEQSNVVRSTQRSNQSYQTRLRQQTKSSDSLDATAKTHTLAFTNNSFVCISTDSLVGGGVPVFTWAGNIHQA